MQAERYKIRNWSNYNKALIQRGSINLWIEEGAIDKWFSTFHTCKAGRPQTYSDETILLLLIFRERFNLTLRTLVGFVSSLFVLMQISLPIPSYTQISRRAQTLHKRIGRLLNKSTKGRHLIFDSTGLKVYGEGEWKIKVHGKAKRRTWRKFHIGIDAETHDIVCVELTGNEEGDAEVAEKMLDKIPGAIKSARGDGAYDASRFRKKVHEKGGECIVPPPRDATYKGAKAGWERERDACLAAIEGFGGGDEGRKLWKKCARYYERSLVETSMFRVKKMLGSSLKARSLGAQQSEAICKCLVINKMNKLGLPNGSWVVNR